MAKVNSDLSSKLEILSIGCSCSDGFKKGHIKESIYGLSCLELLRVWKKREV